MNENYISFIKSLFWDFLWAYVSHWGESHSVLNPYFVGTFTVLLLILFLYYIIRYMPKSKMWILFDFLYEKVYEFFEDILWKDEKKWTKLYITGMFFVILISNLLWVVLEIAWVWFPKEEGEAILFHYIQIPTSDINFNVAMAIIWVIIVIYEQFAFLGIAKALYEYVPFLWKDYIPYEKWKLNKYVDIPLYLLVKFFDIVISVFLWLLEIVWHIAKIISLSFRLFGNITSGWLLLAMLLWGVELLTWSVSWFITGLFWESKTINFPVLFPIILHLQWLLVALIQALVFPLLIAIFIKVAKVH